MHTSLATRWDQLTAGLVPETIRHAAGADLWARYSAPARRYHAWPHVLELLETIDQHAAQLADKEAVQLAAWFHDAIYEPLRSDNEARSAELAAEFLRHSAWPLARQTRVRQLIEHTRDHTLPVPAADTDLQFFLDADLQVLGRPAADYQQYAQHIREEYRVVPTVLYRRGRRRVLEKLLAAPHLYRTPWFREQLEEQARRNLAHELQRWQ